MRGEHFSATELTAAGSSGPTTGVLTGGPSPASSRSRPPVTTCRSIVTVRRRKSSRSTVRPHASPLAQAERRRRRSRAPGTDGPGTARRRVPRNLVDRQRTRRDGPVRGSASWEPDADCTALSAINLVPACRAAIICAKTRKYASHARRSETRPGPSGRPTPERRVVRTDAERQSPRTSARSVSRSRLPDSTLVDARQGCISVNPPGYVGADGEPSGAWVHVPPCRSVRSVTAASHRSASSFRSNVRAR